MTSAERMRRRHRSPETVTLPWRDLDGKPHTAKLFFPHSAGTALHRDRFNLDIWRPALERAGIVEAPKPGERRKPAREHGMHALRHYFASVLLTEGEAAVQAASEWMGHHSPKITWDTYAHLMPKSETRMRKLIDRALTSSSSALNVPSQAKRSRNALV
ncbi:tyrosine-type recombinase/integrase [Thermomonospora cellulosilytica]|uniref:Integrase n=1 Tax=Thermomonospora cellulosilytica TaxID=1411118 RepID=A0A7W3MUV5_9ACTN|nr:tyrosine-type recombinase/integrase [Thermomonospora cellulosilytica]MBA9002257.1 integrase [Thermomonospora cellulosilytica]